MLNLGYPRVSRSNDGGLIQINGGNVTLYGYQGYRGGDNTTSGLVVNGSNAVLNVGSGGITLAISSTANMTLNNGTVTNTGVFIIGEQGVTGRGARYLQNAGTFVSTLTNGIQVAAANNNVATFTVLGGTATAEMLVLVSTNSLTNCMATLTVSNAGTLYLGSGGIVHNLGRVDGRPAAAPPEWAQRFDDWVCERAVAGDDAALADRTGFDDAGRLAVPSPDHYLPLLTVLGTRRGDETVTIPYRGFELGTISLTAVQVG